MILHALPTDAALLASLVNRAYRGDSSRLGWTTEADLLDGTRTDELAIAELLHKEGTVIFKLVQVGLIVGCVQLDRYDDRLYLGMLTVEPGLQGTGIGKQLLKAAEDEARAQACHFIFMTVISVRHELLEWYKRHGYVDTGKRKPFLVPDVRFGIPKQELEFAILEKSLN